MEEPGEAPGERGRREEGGGRKRQRQSKGEKAGEGGGRARDEKREEGASGREMEVKMWLNLFFPTLEHFCPLFIQIPDGSHFAQMGFHFVQNTTPNPCSLLRRHTPLSGICIYTQYPQPHPKAPFFLDWTWKWAKWTDVWATWTSTQARQSVWKVDKSFLKVGQKNYSWPGEDLWQHSEVAERGGGINLLRCGVAADLVSGGYAGARTALAVPSHARRYRSLLSFASLWRTH